jgi:hypothetical protein
MESKFILQLTLPKTVKALVILCYVQAISTKSFSLKNNTINGITKSADFSILARKNMYNVFVSKHSGM